MPLRVLNESLGSYTQLQIQILGVYPLIIFLCGCSHLTSDKGLWIIPQTDAPCLKYPNMNILFPLLTCQSPNSTYINPCFIMYIDTQAISCFLEFGLVILRKEKSCVDICTDYNFDN